jgi:hypothetical protein
MNNLTIHRVIHNDELENHWAPLMRQIFPDIDDQESTEQLLTRLADPHRNIFYMLTDNNTQKPVGIELRQMDPALPGAVYVPWAGLSENYRSKGIYRQMCSICDAHTWVLGGRYCIFETEDPDRIAIAYPDEPLDLLRLITEKRINFWRNIPGTIIIRDPILKYIRPASSDDQKIQDYDLLAVRPVKSPDNLYENILPPNAKIIRIEEFRRLCLETNFLQYGHKSESDLRNQLPAVDQLLMTIDHSKQGFLFLMLDPIRRISLSPEKNSITFAS